MNLLEFKDLVSRLSYKPGWALHVLDDVEHDCVLLRVSFTVPDSTGKQEGPMPLRIKYPLPYHRLKHMDERLVLGWVGQKIMDVERHEHLEWFKLDGVPVRYPHGPTGEPLYLTGAR